MSIRYKTFALISIFSFTMLVSIGATYYLVSSQKKDALMINLAGRQCILSLLIAKEALDVDIKADSGGDAGLARARLQKTASLFGGNLKALIDGGSLMNAAGEKITIEGSRGQGRAYLKEVLKVWDGLRSEIDLITGAATGPDDKRFFSSMNSIMEKSDNLIEAASKAALFFERDSARKSIMLRNSQVFFLLMVFLGFFSCIFYVQSGIVDPLIDLQGVVKEIEKGDLSRRSDFHSDDEIGHLAAGINMMAKSLGDEGDELIAAKEELQRQNEKLLEMGRLKSEFLANLSHELKTPLNAIIGFPSIMLSDDESGLTPQQREDLLMIRKSGEVMLGHVSDLLNFARIEANMVTVQKEIINVADVVSEVISSSNVMNHNKDVHIMQDVEEGLTVLADRKMLKTCLLNLVGNAIKFTEKGEVRVGALFIECDRPSVTFSVSDTGIGVPEEDRNKLFDPFAQADGSTTRKYGGTGLGLAIAKRYIEMHSGTLWVDSQPGVGSIFSFNLPLHDAEQAT